MADEASALPPIPTDVETILPVAEDLLIPGPDGKLPSEGQPASPTVVCQQCKRKPVETDGFCSWHGAFYDMWACDDCIHEMRSRGQLTRIPTLITEDDARHAITVAELAQRNMAMITALVAQDASGANRSVELGLTFRESRVVFEAIKTVLKARLG
jgi:hypothetical protein